MKHLKATLLMILLTLPMVALAHGEEVLITLFIEVVSFIVFAIIIVALKMQMPGKIILAGIYLLTAFVVFVAINFIPYRDNMNAINWAIIIIPLITSCIAYSSLKRYRKG